MYEWCKRKRTVNDQGREISHWSLDKDKLLKDRELLSYSLGFGCSDGWVGYMNGEVRNVEFLSTDRHIIEDLTTRWGYTRPVVLKNPRKQKAHWKDCWGQEFYSDNARWWASLGLRRKKQIFDRIVVSGY